MRGNSNAPAKGKIEMRCKAMSAEQDGREATTLRRHPGILQPNYFKQLQKQRSGSAVVPFAVPANDLQQGRSEEHTSELQSLMRSSYAVFFLKKKTHQY